MFMALFCYNILSVISYITIPLCCSPYTYLMLPLLGCSLGSFVCCLPLTACFSIIPCVSPILFFCSMLSLNLLWWSVVCCYNPCVIVGLMPFCLSCFPCLPCSISGVVFTQINILCSSFLTLCLIDINVIGQLYIGITSCVPCGSCLPILAFECAYPFCGGCSAMFPTMIPLLSGVPCMCLETIGLPIHFIGACCECMCPPLMCLNCLWLIPCGLCSLPCSVPLIGASGVVTLLTLCSPALCLAPCLGCCPLTICPLAICPLAICPLGLCSLGICPLMLGGGCCSSPCLIPLSCCGITPFLCPVLGTPLLGLLEGSTGGLVNIFGEVLKGFNPVCEAIKI